MHFSSNSTNASHSRPSFLLLKHETTSFRTSKHESLPPNFERKGRIESKSKADMRLENTD